MADYGVLKRSLSISLLLLAMVVPAATAQLGVPVDLPPESGVETASLIPAMTPAGTPFTLAQLQYDRVRDARIEVRYGIKKLFRDRGLRYPAADIYMRVFKREHALELWVRPHGDTIYSLLRTYEVCAQSGELGPKRARGDNQVPEGFYSVDWFNPSSDYHLSLHVDYPNRADQLSTTAPDPGGEIFVHGGCNSVGCLALTDEGIKQLYWIAVEARAAGQQRIPIDIYPARLGEEDMSELARVFRGRPALVSFWRTLKPGYDYFEANRRLPNVRVDESGRYVVNNMALPALDLKAQPRPLGTPLGTPVTPLGKPVGPDGAPIRIDTTTIKTGG